MEQRQLIRTKIRQKRDTLTDAQCIEFSQRICRHLSQIWLIQRARKIAFYYPVGNEVDLLPLIEFAWSRQITAYLPVLGLRYTGQLWFVPFQPSDLLYRNRFGIPEPVHDHRHRKTKLRSLDIILMPLVSFDSKGNRIGMGGGFYDKTLANLTITAKWQRPVLIGTAYSLQQVDNIKPEKWDIPLDGVVTEEGIQWT